jgi:hypothetical protein
MKTKYNRFIDLFLLQKDFYSRLTDKSLWLYIGIVFVGIRDVAFNVLNTSSTTSVLRGNLSMDFRTMAALLVTALIIGLVDVLSFSYPVFDIIKHFKKRNEAYNAMPVGNTYSSLLTKVMKVYIMANIILTPLDAVTYFTNRAALSAESTVFMFITSVLVILAYFWFNGVITRGLCILFRLSDNVRGLVFVLVFMWNALIGEAINFLMNQVIMRL